MKFHLNWGWKQVFNVNDPCSFAVLIAVAKERPEEFRPELN